MYGMERFASLTAFDVGFFVCLSFLHGLIRGAQLSMKIGHEVCSFYFGRIVTDDANGMLKSFFGSTRGPTMKFLHKNRSKNKGGKVPCPLGNESGFECLSLFLVPSEAAAIA